MNKSAAGECLPTGWTSSRVEDVILIVDYRGRTPPYSETGIPHIRSSNVKAGKIVWEDLRFVSDETYNRYMTRGLPESGDVLFTTEAPLGEVALAPELKFSLAQRMMLLRPTNALLPKFLLYQIMSDRFQRLLTLKGTGSTVTGVSSRNFKPVAIYIAPLAEQRRIVAKIEELFTKLDAGVAALKTAQAQLKRYRQSVLKAAVEGELTREWREQHKEQLEPASMLLERILRERRAKWEAVQLAKMQAQGKPPKDDKWKAKYQEPATADTRSLHNLPLDWAEATVEQLSDVVQYGSSAKTNDDESGIPVLRMGNIVDGKLNLEKLKYLPSNHEEFPDLILKKGDVLFNRTNSAELVGKTAVYNTVPNPCSFASYLIRLQLSKDYFPDLVAYYLNSFLGKKWISSVVSQQVGQANVNGTKLQALSIPLPPLAEQEQIVSEVERRLSIADEIKGALTAELKRAERLRQAILKRAFEGKLVPQDPNDEPAAVLLERIRQARVTQAATTPTNGKRLARKRKASAAEEPTLPME